MNTNRFAVTLTGLLVAIWQASAATYTFESLANGNLAGQDGWIAYADVSVHAGTGANTTKVISGSAASRVRNAAFNAPSFVATETDAVLGFDFRVVNTALGSTGGVSLSSVEHGWAAGEGPVGLRYDSGFNHLLVTLGDGASYAGGANNFPHVPGHWYRSTFMRRRGPTR